jgi:Mg-chelatase subunit ChlD
MLLCCVINTCVAQQTATVYVTAVNKQNLPVELLKSSMTSKDLTISSVERVKPDTLDCVVVWDSSNSERYAYQSMQVAADAALRKLLAAVPHNCALVLFDSSVEIAKGRADDGSVFAKLLSNIRPGGGTAAYDALGAATEILKKDAAPGPRVIYLFSDFEDNQSHHTLEEVASELVHQRTRIYAFAPDSNSNSGGFDLGRERLRRLVRTTGGAIITVPQKIKPKKMADALANDLSLVSAELVSWWRIEVSVPSDTKSNSLQHLKLGVVDKTLKVNLPAFYFVEN